MTFKVIKPGVFSTLQDEGRYGHRKHGVIVSGAMDLFAHRAANLLVANSSEAVTLEMTLSGAILVAEKDLLVAICGADMDAKVDGTSAPLWRPFVIRGGSELSFHYAVQGCRAYLAVHGGFAADYVLGSRSTYLRAGMGGFQGRALRSGDVLGVGEVGEKYGGTGGEFRHRGEKFEDTGGKFGHTGEKFEDTGGKFGHIGEKFEDTDGEFGHIGEKFEDTDGEFGHTGEKFEDTGGDFRFTGEKFEDIDDLALRSKFVSTTIRPNYQDHPEIRIVRGNEADLITSASWSSLLSQSFVVTSQSDRMGYRLSSELKLELDPGVPYEMISEGVAAGTLQVPSSGQPILLMADCQTTGGYPRIGHVITADLPLVAQVKPGGTLRFREVTHREAQEQLLLQAMDLKLLEAGMRVWLRGFGVR
jgi:allophanate hydrolase subunit 2